MQSRCERLRHLRSTSDTKAERILCESCPLPACIYEKPLKPRPAPPIITERYAQCTQCQATETLYFTGDVLQTTLRWHQVGNSILHKCGQAQLFPSSPYR